MRRRKPRPPRALGSLLAGVMSDLGLAEAGGIVRIAQCWEAAVGSEVARHCRPTALRGTTLEATVDTSVWCHALQLQSRRILDGLRRELGEGAPSELRLFVG
jgi:predicted nucleic acid-binding Zn ribbon protein